MEKTNKYSGDDDHDLEYQHELEVCPAGQPTDGVLL